jgi:hypothetical protein
MASVKKFKIKTKPKKTKQQTLDGRLLEEWEYERKT